MGGIPQVNPWPSWSAWWGVQEHVGMLSIPEGEGAGSGCRHHETDHSLLTYPFGVAEPMPEASTCMQGLKDSMLALRRRRARAQD